MSSEAVAIREDENKSTCLICERNVPVFAKVKMKYSDYRALFSVFDIPAMTAMMIVPWLDANAKEAVAFHFGTPPPEFVRR